MTMNANRFQTCGFYFVLLLLVLTPLLYIEPRVLGVSLPDAFNFPKRYLVETVSLAFLILLVGESVSRGKLRVRVCRCLLPYSLFIIWSALSLIYAPGFHHGWREFIRWASYGVIFLTVVTLCPTARRIKLISSAAMLSGFLVSIIALAQFFGLDPSSFSGELHRVYSTLGNPNYIASYLAVVLPLGYWGWISAGAGGGAAIASLAFSVVGTAALCVTGSRGGMAALFAGVVAAAVLSRVSLLRHRLLLLIILVGLLAVSLLLPSPLNRYDTLAVEKAMELAGDAGPRTAGMAWRAMVWKACLRMVRQHPLRGTGLGSFRLLYLNNLAEIMKQPENRSFEHIAEGGIDFAHNDYLQIWVELGIVGLALFLWFLLSLGAASVRSAREMSGERWIDTALLGGCAAFLANALVSFTFHNWASAVTFFIFSGVLAARRSVTREVALEAFLPRAASVTVAALIAASAIYWMYSSIVSEIHCANGLKAFYRKERSLALREFGEASRWQPQNGRARFFFGMCLMDEHRLPEALREMLASQKTYRRQAIHVQLGRLYSNTGRWDDAARSLEAAVSMLPRDPEAWLAKGNLLFRRGDREGAVACYKKCLSFRSDYFEAARNIAVTYDALGMEDEALAAYEGALELRPGDAGLYVNMGAIHARGGGKARARELWEKALSLDPGNAGARENLDLLNKEQDKRR